MVIARDSGDRLKNASPGSIVAHYVFQPLTKDAEDWGEIVVYRLDGIESYQVQRKGKDIGQPHTSYKTARDAMQNKVPPQ
jgi:hypothetical protein